MESSFLDLSPSSKRSGRNCPDCDEEMRLFHAADVLIDKCGQCHGIWLDHLEFPIFKRTLDSYDLRRIREIYQMPEDENSYRIQNCPGCEIPLVDVKYSYNSGVEFRKCIKCLGLWLPINQTLKLIALSKVGQEISRDLKGLVAEIQSLEAERKKYHELESLGHRLKGRVRRYVLLGWLVFRRIL